MSGPSGGMASRRIHLDANDVEVEVAPIARSSHDRAVRPRLQHITHRSLRRIAPGPRAGRHFPLEGTRKSHATSLRRAAHTASATQAGTAIAWEEFPDSRNAIARL